MGFRFCGKKAESTLLKVWSFESVLSIFWAKKRPAPRSQFSAGPPLISDVNQLT